MNRICLPIALVTLDGPVGPGDIRAKGFPTKETWPLDAPPTKHCLRMRYKFTLTDAYRERHEGVHPPQQRRLGRLRLREWPRSRRTTTSGPNPSPKVSPKDRDYLKAKDSTA